MRTLLGAFIVMFGFAAWGDTGGAATYDRLCKSCHGADGKGSEAKAKILKVDLEKLDLTRPEAGQAKAQVEEIVLKGKKKMPAYQKKLKPEEVAPLIDYTLQFAKPAKPAK